LIAGLPFIDSLLIHTYFMLGPTDNYFANQHEPIKSCMQFLRMHILKLDKNMVEAWKYGMPFFCYKEKMFCYIWFHKKYGQPYIGIVEGNKINHADLLKEKRSRMKILLIDANKDIPVRKINRILKEVLSFYK
jgi:hypothetical protein